MIRRRYGILPSLQGTLCVQAVATKRCREPSGQARATEGTKARNLAYQESTARPGWSEVVVREGIFCGFENMDVFEEPYLIGFWQRRRREPVWATV